MLLPLRMMWKDWGFAATLYEQARHFLTLAKASTSESDVLAHIRASIVFSLMSFEAHYREAVRGFMQNSKADITPHNYDQVENDIKTRLPIRKAVENWPELLTGRPMPIKPRSALPINTTNAQAINTTLDQRYHGFFDYRNSLVHGVQSL